MFEKSKQPNWEFSKNFNKPKTASKKLVPKLNKDFIKIQLDVITFTIDIHNYRFYDKMPKEKSVSKRRKTLSLKA